MKQFKRLMTPLLILVAAAILFCHCTGTKSLTQQETWATYYKDQLTPGFQLLAAGSNFTFEKGPDYYWYQTYFYDTKVITEQQKYADKLRKKRIGKRQVFTDDGSKWMEQEYKNGLLDGESRTYHLGSTQVSEVCQYSKGKQDGLSISYYTNGQMQATGQYVSGQLDGEWIHYDKDGTEKRRNLWKNGEPQGQNADEAKNSIQIKPSFPCNSKFENTSEDKCGESALFNYLVNDVKYPPASRNKLIQGTALAVFVIDSTGSVRDVVIPNGVCYEIKNEVKRLIEAMPAWNPGSVNGQKVKVQYTLPVRFRLE